MEIVNRKDGIDARKIDATCKDKWKWEWLEVKDKSGFFLSDYIRKLNTAGKAICIICNIVITYGSGGRKQLLKHGNSDSHKVKRKTKDTNQSLPSWFAARASAESGERGINKSAKANDNSCEMPYGAPPNCHDVTMCTSGKVPLPVPNVSYVDRKANAEALVTSFVAENNIKFSQTQKVINLAKELAKDPRVLQDLSMERTTCSYKLTEGLGLVTHKRIVSDMQKYNFSINLDECTSKTNERVLSVLSCYYSETLKMCVVQHYASITLTTVNAQTVFHALRTQLEKDGIPLTNIVSSLSDSAAYMRGRKTGFETKLREIAPHLLDIDGDICHSIHNTVKKFCEPFGNIVEHLDDDLFNDMRWSSDLREILSDICIILGPDVECKIPTERVSHRWLSSYFVTLRNKEMLDPLTLFYYAWVDRGIVSAYKPIIDELFVKYKTTAAQKKALTSIWAVLKGKNLTDLGLKRKKRIVDKLFYHRDNTLATMEFYCTVLPMFQSFVLTFERKEPMAHVLYDEMTDLFKHFLVCFIAHEKVTNLSGLKLAKFNISQSDMLKPSQMFIGAACGQYLLKMKPAGVAQFYEKVKIAYLESAKYLQRKLPLQNNLLRHLSAIDPKAQGYQKTHEYLKKLLTEMKCNDLTPSQVDEFHLQASKLQLDKNLPAYDNDTRVDKWWGQVLQRYPALKPVVSRALSIFTGPRIEQSFSMMNSVVTKASNRLSVATFSAIQTVKFDLLSTNETSLERYRRPDKLKSPVDEAVCFHMRTAYSRYKRKLEEKRKKKVEKAKDYGHLQVPKKSKKGNPKVNVHTLARINKAKMILNNKSKPTQRRKTGITKRKEKSHHRSK